MKANMLGCMPLTNQRAPFPAIDVYILTILYPLVSCRQGRNAGAKLAKPLPVAIETALIKSSTLIKPDRILGHIFRLIKRHHLAHIKITATHPQGAIKLLSQPTRVPSMVCVQMRGDHPRNRLPP